MYLVYLLSQYLGADYDIISAMSLSGILLLVEYPIRLMEGGFQISYLSIFIIGGILPRVQDIIQKKNHGDDAMKSRPSGGKKSFVAMARQTLLSGLVIGCVTAPFLMRLFYEWSPLSLVLNLILLPCMVPLMMSAVCGGLAGLFAMEAGRICLLPAQGILMVFHRTFDMTDRLPLKIWVTGCPAIWQLFIIYSLMIIIFYLLLYPDLIKVLSILFALILLLVYEQTGSVSLLSQTRESGLKIDMLDVGQGECNLIRTADRKTVMIDGGSSSRDNIGRDVIIPALKYYGVKRIDYLLATHMDLDHISGLTELFARGFPVRHVLIADAGRNDPAWTSFYKLALKSGCHVSLISRGDRISFGRMTLSCLHPHSGYEPEDRNDSSVVLALAWRQFDMLFTGDLGPEGEKDLISYLEGISGNSRLGKRLKSPRRKLDVLKVAHHGSAYSTSREFLAKYPGIRAALISAGKIIIMATPTGPSLNA